MPAAAWRFTISATEDRTSSAYAAGSFGGPVRMLAISSIALGRGILPTCVVRMRSSLRFMRARPVSARDFLAQLLRRARHRFQLAERDCARQILHAAIRRENDPL